MYEVDGLSARLQQPQCVSNGVTAVLHLAFEVVIQYFVNINNCWLLLIYCHYDYF